MKAVKLLHVYISTESDHFYTYAIRQINLHKSLIMTYPRGALGSVGTP